MMGAMIGLLFYAAVTLSVLQSTSAKSVAVSGDVVDGKLALSTFFQDGGANIQFQPLGFRWGSDPAADNSLCTTFTTAADSSGSAGWEVSDDTDGTTFEDAFLSALGGCPSTEISNDHPAFPTTLTIKNIDNSYSVGSSVEVKLNFDMTDADVVSEVGTGTVIATFTIYSSLVGSSPCTLAAHNGAFSYGDNIAHLWHYGAVQIDVKISGLTTAFQTDILRSASGLSAAKNGFGSGDLSSEVQAGLTTHSLRTVSSATYDITIGSETSVSIDVTTGPNTPFLIDDDSVLLAVCLDQNTWHPAHVTGLSHTDGTTELSSNNILTGDCTDSSMYEAVKSGSGSFVGGATWLGGSIESTDHGLSAGDVLFLEPDLVGNDGDCTVTPTITHVDAVTDSDNFDTVEGGEIGNDGCPTSYTLLETTSLSVGDSDVFLGPTLILSEGGYESVVVGDILVISCPDADQRTTAYGQVSHIDQITPYSIHFVDIPFGEQGAIESPTDCSGSDGLLVDILVIKSDTLVIALPQIRGLTVSETNELSFTLGDALLATPNSDGLPALSDGLCTGHVATYEPLTCFEYFSSRDMRNLQDGTTLRMQATTVFDNDFLSSLTVSTLDSTGNVWLNSPDDDGLSGSSYPRGYDPTSLSSSNIGSFAGGSIHPLQVDDYFLSFDRADACTVGPYRVLSLDGDEIEYDNDISSLTSCSDVQIAVPLDAKRIRSHHAAAADSGNPTRFLLPEGDLPSVTVGNVLLVDLEGSDDCGDFPGFYEIVSVNDDDGNYIELDRDLLTTGTCDPGYAVETTATALTIDTTAPTAGCELDVTDVPEDVFVGDWLWLRCDATDDAGAIAWLGELTTSDDGSVTATLYMDGNCVTCTADLEIIVVRADSFAGVVTATDADDDLYFDEDTDLSWMIDKNSHDIELQCTTTILGEGAGVVDDTDDLANADDDEDTDEGLWNMQADLAVSETMIRNGAIDGAADLRLVLDWDSDFEWDMDSDEKKTSFIESFEASTETEMWDLVLQTLKDSDLSTTIPDVTSDDTLTIVFPQVADFDIPAGTIMEITITGTTDVAGINDDSKLIVPTGSAYSIASKLLIYADDVVAVPSQVQGYVTDNTLMWVSWRPGPSQDPVAMSTVQCQRYTSFNWEGSPVLVNPTDVPFIQASLQDDDPGWEDWAPCLLTVWTTVGRRITVHLVLEPVTDAETAPPLRLAEAGFHRDAEKHFLDMGRSLGLANSVPVFSDQELPPDDNGVVPGRGSRLLFGGNSEGSRSLGGGDATSFPAEPVEWVDVLGRVEVDRERGRVTAVYNEEPTSAGYSYYEAQVGLTYLLDVTENPVSASAFNDGTGQGDIDAALDILDTTALCQVLWESEDYSEGCSFPDVTVEKGDYVQISEEDAWASLTRLTGAQSGAMYSGIFHHHGSDYSFEDAWSDSWLHAPSVPARVGMPIQVTAHSDSVTLWWPPPSFNGGFPILSYQVQCTSDYLTENYDDVTSWEELVSDVVTDTDEAGNIIRMVTIEGVPPSSQYSCRVLATNQIGTSYGYVRTKYNNRDMQVSSLSWLLFDRGLDITDIDGNEISFDSISEVSECTYGLIDGTFFSFEEWECTGAASSSPRSCTATIVDGDTTLVDTAEEIYCLDYTIFTLPDDSISFIQPHPPRDLEVSHSVDSDDKATFEFSWKEPLGTLSGNQAVDVYLFQLQYPDPDSEDGEYLQFDVWTSDLEISLGHVGSGADIEIDTLWEMAGGAAWRAGVSARSRAGLLGHYTEIGFVAPSTSWDGSVTRCVDTTNLAIRGVCSGWNMCTEAYPVNGVASELADVFTLESTSMWGKRYGLTALNPTPDDLEDDTYDSADHRVWRRPDATIEVGERGVIPDSAGVKLVSFVENGFVVAVPEWCAYGPGVTDTPTAKSSVTKLVLQYSTEEDFNSGASGDEEDLLTEVYNEAYVKEFTVSDMTPFFGYYYLSMDLPDSGRINTNFVISVTAYAGDDDETGTESTLDISAVTLEEGSFSPSIMPPVVAEADREDTVEVSWEGPYVTPLVPVTFWQVRYFSGHTPPTLVEWVDAKENSVTLEELLGGEIYWVSARACSGSQWEEWSTVCGPWSFEARVTTQWPGEMSSPRISRDAVTAGAANLAVSPPKGSAAVVIHGEIRCRLDEYGDDFPANYDDVHFLSVPECSQSDHTVADITGKQISLAGYEAGDKLLCISRYFDHLGREYQSSPVTVTVADTTDEAMVDQYYGMQFCDLTGDTDSLLDGTQYKLASPVDADQCLIVALSATKSSACPSISSFTDPDDLVPQHTLARTQAEDQLCCEEFEFTEFAPLVRDSDQSDLVDESGARFYNGADHCYAFTCKLDSEEAFSTQSSDWVGPFFHTFGDSRAHHPTWEVEEPFEVHSVVDRAALIVGSHPSYSLRGDSDEDWLRYEVACTPSDDTDNEVFSDTLDDADMPRLQRESGSPFENGRVSEFYVTGLDPATDYTCTILTRTSNEDGHPPTQVTFTTEATTAGTEAERLHPLAMKTPSVVTERDGVTSSDGRFGTLSWTGLCSGVTNPSHCTGSEDTDVVDELSEGTESEQNNVFVSTTALGFSTEVELSYLLRFRRQGSSSWHVWHLSDEFTVAEDVSVPLLTSGGLHAGETYEFQVGAMNNYLPLLLTSDASDINWSRSAVVQVPVVDGAVLPSPEYGGITVDDVDGHVYMTDINLHPSKKWGGGTLEGVQVQCRSASADSWDDITAGNVKVFRYSVRVPSVPFLALGDLDPDSAYYCRLFSINENGLSQPSHSNTVFTSPSASDDLGFPSKVGTTSFSVEATSDTSALVSFSPPTHDGGAPVLGYVIKATGETEIEFDTESPNAEFEITGLEGYHQYTFSVKAYNAADKTCGVDERAFGDDLARNTDELGDNPGDSAQAFITFPLEDSLVHSDAVDMPKLSEEDTGVNAVLLHWDSDVVYNVRLSNSQTVLQVGVKASDTEGDNSINWSEVDTALDTDGVVPAGWSVWRYRYATGLAAGTEHHFRLRTLLRALPVDGASQYSSPTLVFYSNTVTVTTLSTSEAPLTPIPVSDDGESYVQPEVESPVSIDDKSITLSFMSEPPEVGAGGGGFKVVVDGHDLLDGSEEETGSVEFTGVDGNTSYQFDVSYVDSEGAESRTFSSYGEAHSTCLPPRSTPKVSVQASENGIEALTDTAALLIWDDASEDTRGSDVFSYRIDCYDDEELTSIDSSEEVNSEVTEWYVTGLNPDSDLWCYVAVVSEEDACSTDESEDVSIRTVKLDHSERHSTATALQMPAPVVLDCEGDATTTPLTTEVTVGWAAYANDAELRGTATEDLSDWNYQVQWKKSKDDTYATIDVDRSDTTYHFTGLQAGAHSYSFRVRAYHFYAPDGEWSSPLVYPSNGAAPTPPSKPTGTVVDQKRASLLLSWAVDDGGSPLQLVEAKCKRGAPLMDGSDAWLYTAEFVQPLSSGVVFLVDGNVRAPSEVDAEAFGLDDTLDSFVYYCVVQATNEVGTSPPSSPFTLGASLPTSQGQPLAMQQPKLVSKTSSSVTINFTLPLDTDGSPVRGYFVSLLSEESTQEVTSLNTTVSITGLTESTEYHFSVASYNRHIFDNSDTYSDRSLSSPTLTVTTDVGERPPQVDAPQVVDVARDAVALSWQRPLSDTSPITRVQLVCGLDTSDSGDEFELTETGEVCSSEEECEEDWRLIYAIDGLDSSSLYLCAAAISNRRGETIGAFATVETLESDIDTSLPLFEPPSCKAEGDGEVSLSWSAPVGGDEAVDEYEVEGKGRITSASRSVTVSGLSANSEYQFTVTYGGKKASPACAVTTNPTVPSQVKQTSLLSLTSDKALLLVQSPDSMGSEITSYHVSCGASTQFDSDNDDTELSEWTDGEAGAVFLHVDVDLEETVYCFVSASNDEGQGEYGGRVELDPESISFPAPPLVPMAPMEVNTREGSAELDSFDGRFLRSSDAVKISFGTEVGTSVYSDGLGGDGSDTVQGFVIRWGRELEHVVTHPVGGALDEEDMFSVFSGLEGGVTYMFQVAAFTQSEQNNFARAISEYSPPLSITTHNSTLDDVPELPVAMDVGQESALLYIQSATNGNPVGSQSYQVECRDRHTPGSYPLAATSPSPYLYLHVRALTQDSATGWVCRAMVLNKELGQATEWSFDSHPFELEGEGERLEPLMTKPVEFSELSHNTVVVVMSVPPHSGGDVAPSVRSMEVAFALTSDDLSVDDIGREESGWTVVSNTLEDWCGGGESCESDLDAYRQGVASFDLVATIRGLSSISSYTFVARAIAGKFDPLEGPWSETAVVVTSQRPLQTASPAVEIIDSDCQNVVIAFGVQEVDDAVIESYNVFARAQGGEQVVQNILTVTDYDSEGEVAYSYDLGGNEMQMHVLGLPDDDGDIDEIIPKGEPFDIRIEIHSSAGTASTEWVSADANGAQFVRSDSSEACTPPRPLVAFRDKNVILLSVRDPLEDNPPPVELAVTKPNSKHWSTTIKSSTNPWESPTLRSGVVYEVTDDSVEGKTSDPVSVDVATGDPKGATRSATLALTTNANVEDISESALSSMCDVYWYLISCDAAVFPGSSVIELTLVSELDEEIETDELESEGLAQAESLGLVVLAVSSTVVETQVLSATSDAVFLSLPRIDDGGSDFTSVQVECDTTEYVSSNNAFDSDQGVAEVSEVSPTGQEPELGVAIGGMSSATNYTCRVTYSNQFGSFTPTDPTEYGDPVSAMSSDFVGKPLRMVRPLVAAGEESGTIDVSFPPPASDGGSSVTQYLLQYRLRDYASQLWTLQVDADDGADEIQVTVTGLVAGISYAFAVAADNDVEGSIQFSSEAFASTAPSLPRQPGPPLLANLNSTTVTVTLDGKDENGLLADGGLGMDRYLLQYEALPEGFSTMSEDDRTTALNNLTYPNPDPSNVYIWPLRAEMGGATTPPPRDVAVGVISSRTYAFRYAIVNEFGIGEYSDAALIVADDPQLHVLASTSVAVEATTTNPSGPEGEAALRVWIQRIDVDLEVGVVTTVCAEPLHTFGGSVSVTPCQDVALVDETMGDDDRWSVTFSTYGDAEVDPQVYRGGSYDVTYQLSSTDGRVSDMGVVPSVTVTPGRPYPAASIELVDAVSTDGNATIVNLEVTLSWHGGSEYTSVTIESGEFSTSATIVDFTASATVAVFPDAVITVVTSNAFGSEAAEFTVTAEAIQNASGTPTSGSGSSSVTTPSSTSISIVTASTRSHPLGSVFSLLILLGLYLVW